MGTLWGATAATPQHSPTIYADIELGAGGSIPIEAEADERAVMLVGGEAELDGSALELFTLYVLRARPRGAPVERDRRAGHADGRQALHARRATSSGISSRPRATGSTRPRRTGRRMRFPLIPGDDQEFIPLPEVPKTVSYP